MWPYGVHLHGVEVKINLNMGYMKDNGYMLREKKVLL